MPSLDISLRGDIALAYIALLSVSSSRVCDNFFGKKE